MMMTRFKWVSVWGLVAVTVLMTVLASLPLGADAARGAFGFGPRLYKSGYNYGTGLYFAPYRFTVYEQPATTAPVIGEFRWGRNSRSNHIDVFSSEGQHFTLRSDHVFFCFYPELDVAMLAVIGDDEQGGWLEVVYDQQYQKTGWVQVGAGTSPTGGKESKPAHFGVFQTWLDFMKLNAKANGVYWLSGVNQYQRSVRQADADDAKLIPITIIRSLKVKHLRGNWMLVEVLDFERNTPIGWVRWRDDDGNLMVFPNLSGQHLPVVTTAY